MKNSWEILGDFQLSSAQIYDCILKDRKIFLVNLAKLSEEFSY